MNRPATHRYACYRRPDPETGQIYRKDPKAGEKPSEIGRIEYVTDPAFFFHAEKYRGIDEPCRLKVMDADSMADVEAVLSATPLNEQQRARWARVRDRVLHCALWFAATQHTGRALGFSPDRYDGLDVLGEMTRIQERLHSSPTRLVIAGSRGMTGRPAGYALIDWFVQNRDLAATGHGVESVDEVVSGNADGADSIGEEWGMREYVPVAHFPAPWDALGRGAGFARNEEMAKVGTHLLVFHLGNSRGTANMISQFMRARKPYWQFTDKDVARMREMLADSRPRDASDDPSFGPQS